MIPLLRYTRRGIDRREKSWAIRLLNTDHFCLRGEVLVLIMVVSSVYIAMIVDYFISFEYSILT